MSLFFRVNEADNVAVALKDAYAGANVIINGLAITLKDDVSQAQKVALKSFSVGEEVIKYGYPIGHTIESIPVGGLVNHFNIKTNLGDVNEYEYVPDFKDVINSLEDHDVNIYRRANGQVAIRNELWIIPTVGCVNAMTKIMKRNYENNNDISDIDGINIFTHQFGCSQLGVDHETTKLMLQRLATHPNAGGVLVVGLGCENNQIQEFKDSLGEYDENRVEFMICQSHQDEIEVGMSYITDLHNKMKNDRRELGKLSEVRFGLECGGSDGLSGITANPLLGRFSDYLISNGGTSVLTEVPEMFGAEEILMSRCDNIKVFSKTVSMINEFKQHFIDHNQPIYENPSPGNKAGGISTLEEKSLGCTQKSGTSNVMNVLKYGDILTTPGLNLLSAPGNDAIATSALSISGCHMVLFSTGRGTPYGGPVPTFKIATNSQLANFKPHWIDFNAGKLIENVTMDQLLKCFIKKIINTVNGEQTCNEKNDFREIAVYKMGVTL